MARSVLEKLTRLALTNQLTEDQTTAVLALGDQLLQSPGVMPRPCSSQFVATRCSTDHKPSEASLLADTVVQQTVGRVCNELASKDVADALQRRSTVSMLADTVVQQTLREISNDLMTSEMLSPRPDSAKLDKAVQVAAISSSTCPPGICTELTKYIVMNAVDIALSCARRAATKQTGTDGKTSPVTARRAPCDTGLIDAFIDRLSNEVYGNLSATARQPTSDAVLAISRSIDDDLRCQCLANSQPCPSESMASPDGVSPFAEVLMKLALHDRLGDLQRHFVDGHEMIELATCVLKSHVQTRGTQSADDGQTTTSGTV